MMNKEEKEQMEKWRSKTRETVFNDMREAINALEAEPTSDCVFDYLSRTIDNGIEFIKDERREKEQLDY